ncbi:MAG: hypothetical protein Q9195_009283 [Heterodermia aff. obscurata]
MESPSEKSFKSRKAPPYRYNPLDEARQEIRLMTLFPGSFIDPILLSIQRKPLTTTQIPSFEALSYAWGNISDRQHVFILKKSKLAAKWKKMTFSSSGWTTLSVTSKLSEALRYIRYKEAPRVLWIDAVCVDQQNLNERGKQVLRMPDIYSLANGVIAWLGPESSSSALAMKTIVNMGSRITVDFEQDNIELTSDAYRSFEHFDESLQLDKEAYRAIRGLLHRSWFERLWILQELYFGRERIHMLCGFERTSWEQFCYAMVYLQSIDASNPDKIGDRLDKVRLTMTYKEGRFRDHLIDLLRTTRYLQCSDPRDKVYALLNLVSEDSWKIQPDFSKPTPEVFQSVIEHSLNEDKSLLLLTDCAVRERTPSMPSWVPDWSIKSQFRETICHNCAFLGSRAYANIINSDVLVTIGIQVTTVHEVMNKFPQEIPGTANELAEFVRKVMLATDGSVPDMTTQSRTESLCRTLCCNIFAEQWHPPRTEYPSFPNLIKQVMNNFEVLIDNLGEPSEVCSLYARCANQMMTGRALAMMANRLFGLVPEGTRLGDIICVVFGCYVPLVLRPDEGSTFSIVGECYVDGVMNGEPLLGELPKNWSLVRRRIPNASLYHTSFLDNNTETIQKEDPRLTGPLPLGWRIKSHDHEALFDWYVNDTTGEDNTIFDPRVNPTALKEQRGVDIREFRLI